MVDQAEVPESESALGEEHSIPTRREIIPAVIRERETDPTTTVVTRVHVEAMIRLAGTNLTRHAAIEYQAQSKPVCWRTRTS
jgi:hypothetical protein